MTDETPVTPVTTPQRSLWQREPVVVITALFTLLGAINAVLLGAGAYDGGVAAAITGIIAALGAFVNTIFVRAEVVPLRPLEDLAAADKAA
jgi:predicted lysophospholipase L1 biosynthesis ABC-type transport system permease subunit